MHVTHKIRWQFAKQGGTAEYFVPTEEKQFL